MSFTCENCSKTFTTSVMLQIHKKQHNVSNDYICEFCLCTYSSLYELKEHLKTHPGDNPWLCLICRQRFSRASSFKKHRLFHEAEVLGKDEFYNKIAKPTKYRMKQIPRECNTEATLFIARKADLRCENYKKGPFHTCKACCVIFPTKYDLDKHLEMDQLKKFKCKKCGKLFGQDASLIRHEESHQIGGFHCCEVCQKLIPKKEDLDKHIKTHEYSEKCLRCAERYIMLDDMLTHQELHLGLIHYECEICKEKFSNFRNLEEHLETHTNAQRCKVCERFLNGVEDFKQHVIQTHTIMKPFDCNQCYESFTNKERLSTHYKAHARDYVLKNIPQKSTRKNQPITEN